MPRPLLTVRPGLVFFDRVSVTSASDRARVRVLSRLGAFTRQRVISSMVGHRVRKGFGVKSKVTNRSGSSAVGQPPSPHTGDLVKRISFAYDPATASMVAGPTPFRSGLGARALEEGGAAPIFSRGRRRLGHFRKFPYMLPAFQEELKQVPNLLRGSIRK